MKRFLVFGYDQYYPAGGWGDFVADYDTFEEAFGSTKESEYRPDTYEIVDTETQEITYT